MCGSCFCCVFVNDQFVADGVFFAELNELLTRELAEDGYSGVEVRVTPMRTEIIIRATRTQSVLGAYELLIHSLYHFSHATRKDGIMQVSH